MAELIDSYSTGSPAGGLSLGGTVTGRSMSFTSPNYASVVSSVTAAMQVSSLTPVGSNVVAKIYEHAGTFGSSSIPTGAPLAVSAGVPIETLSYGTTEPVEFVFSGVNRREMSPDTHYTVAFEFTGVDGTVIYVSYGTPDAEHPGSAAVLPLGSSSWSASSTSINYVFEVYAEPPPPPPPTDWSAVGKEDEKVYIYKVTKPNGDYVGVWADTKDTLEFTHRINTAGTTTTVLLARSANTTKEVRANLLTQAGEPLTAEDGARLVTVYESPNTVGEDTDVELGYLVDIFVHYGEFGRLLTQLGEPLLTQSGDYLKIASGAPLGVRVFSGYILDYDSAYGETSAVEVTVASNGMEFSDEVIRDGDTTNVTYTTTELATIVKSIIDTNPGRMSYDNASIITTGVTKTMKFQLNSKLEGIESVFDQTPDGWYWYGNPADNNVYLRPISTGYDHIFTIGHDIKMLNVRRSMEKIKNVVYVVGGEVTPGNPATTLYKKYEDAASIAMWGRRVERIVDRRVTLTTTAQAKAQKVLSQYAQPIFNSPLVISSARYDIESVKLGETIGFRGFGNFIDALPPLPIVSYSYAGTSLTVELGALMPRQVDNLADVQESLNNEQYEALPNAPS